MTSLAIGAVTVIGLCDATGPFFEPPGAAFPTASPAVWQDAARLDPGAVGDDGGWWLHFRCFAVRRANGDVTLVDAGIGPAVPGRSTWTPVPGRLPALLAGAGIDPAEVSTVVLTHLHSDHTGWAVLDEQPYFPNARYVLQRDEYDAVDAGAASAVLTPLRDNGQLDLLDGRHRLAPEIVAIPTPGHTPGHQSVVVSSRDAELVVTGDALVHAVQLADPTVAYRYETDPDRARASRTRLLAEARDHRATLATAHLAEPFITDWWTT